MIKPTIGRIVWFWNHGTLRGGQPEAAIVAYVHSDTMVNLGVFRDNGNCSGFMSVPLWQGEGTPPDGAYCEWMPYQKGQAAKTEQLEKQAAAPSIENEVKRELTGHKVNPANDVLKIEVLDAPGSGGANHLYHITGFNSASNPSDPWTKRHGTPAQHSTILFQNGPIAEVGVNGVTHEALLAIVIDRIAAFQSGPFANDYNAAALSHLQSAQGALLDRTRARMARGVEGTHTP